MRNVHPSEVGAVDLGTLMREQSEAQAKAATASEPRSEVFVYVLEVTFFGEYGWTSVHRTPEGAQARLEAKVDEYGVRDAYEAELSGAVEDANSRAAGDEGDAVVWGISRLPVEE